MHQKLLDNVDG